MKSKNNYIFLKTLSFFVIIFFLVAYFYTQNLKNIYTNETKNSINFELNNKIKLIDYTIINISEDIQTLINILKTTANDKEINTILKNFKNSKKEYLKTEQIKSNKNKLEIIENKDKNSQIVSLDISIPIKHTNNIQKNILHIVYDLKSLLNNISDSELINRILLVDSNKVILEDKKDEYILSKNIGKNAFELSWKVVSLNKKKFIHDKMQIYLNSIVWIIFLYFMVAVLISYTFTEYKRREKENKLKFRLSNSIFQNSHDGIIITNHKNKIIQVNKKFTQITGYQEKEILNKTPDILKSSGVHGKQFYKNIWKNLETNGKWEGEIVNERKDGLSCTEELSISKIVTDEDDIYYIATFNDITETKKAKKIIADKLEENKTYMEIINSYLITLKVDIHGQILDVSDAFTEICGYTKEELIGNSHNIFRHPDTTKEFYIKIWNIIYSGKTWEGELKNLKKNGQEYYVHTKISPIYSNSTVVGYASIAVDITDKKRVEEMSITDELTQTYNRRYFNIAIEKELLRAKRDNKTLGFAILDVDYFKQYNDTYGHIKGDKALQEVANIIKSSTNRASDFSFRLGGEEFGILVTDINEKNFLNLLEKVRLNIKNLHIEHANSTISKSLTASFGAVIFDSNINEEKMYKKADKLLYKAKEEGRNRVLIEDITHLFGH